MVYVSGPYRAPTRAAIAKNIQAAYDAATTVWEMGAAVLCPHKNTEDMEGVVELTGLLEGDFEFVRRSDAVLMLSGWHLSLGAQLERDVAIREDIALFYQDNDNWQQAMQTFVADKIAALNNWGNL